MSVLLRHPATVPALFSRAADPPARAERGPNIRGRFAPSATLLWITAVLCEAPLAQAAAAVVGAALPH